MGDSLASVPPELKGRDHWVLWRTIVRRGEPSKVLFRVDDPTQTAKSNDPATWAGFEAAASAFRPDVAEGLGYVFSEHCPFVGIDFDGCLDESGEVAEWAARWLDRLPGSYMEVSPSGKGIKAWVRGKLSGTGGKRALEGKHTGIEVYDRGRFFAVTGNAHSDIPAVIAEHQGVIDELYAWVKDRPKKGKPTPPREPGAFTRTVPAEGGASNVERAAAYLDAIDPAVSGKGGHNQLLTAACRMVEFGLDYDTAFRLLWTGYNPRCEPEWTEAEVHHKLRSAFDRAEHGKKLKEDPPREAKKARTTDLDARLAKKARTDMGNGERLAARAAGRLRYCEPWKKWLVWDGRRYKLDDSKLVEKHAKDTVRLMHAETATLESEDEQKKHAYHAMGSQARAAVSNMLAMAASEPGIPILPAEMDRDGWLLNCLNGTIDLRTGALRPHDQADAITKLCPVEFDPYATCPLWEATLELFFNGDQKVIAYWQRVCGYALVGVVRDHVLPIAYGDGSNGKSTVLGAMLDVLGPDYAMKAPPDMLMAKGHDTHPTERADLFGKRLVVAIETAEGRRLDETMVKELTGGDKIRARRMREDFWEFNPSHTLIMATNHRPRIRGTDNGIWRRLKLIPFTVKVEGAKADTKMGEKLKAEAAGILAWAVRGCLSWQEVGLYEPDSVVAATTEYRSEQDVLGSFLAERTIQNPGFRTKCGEVYQAYKQWAEAAGERPVSLTEFGSRMDDRGIDTIKNNVKWYIGIGLKDDDNPFGVVA